MHRHEHEHEHEAHASATIRTPWDWGMQPWNTKGGGALECCVVRFISRAGGGRAPSHQALVVDDSRARAEGSHEVFKYCAGYARLPDHAGSMKRAAGPPKPDQPNDNFFTALVGVVSVGAGSHLLEWGMRSCDELERQHESTLRDGL